jgi:hypothetical protein
MQHPFSVTQSSLLHVLKRSFNDELHVPVADGESHTNSNQVRHNKRSRQDRGISFIKSGIINDLDRIEAYHFEVMTKNFLFFER